MTHHSTPALALAAALALTGVSVPALAASSQPGGALPANPTQASSTDAQSGTRVEDAQLSIRQAEAGGVTLPDASSVLETADDTPTTIIVQLEDGTAGSSTQATRDDVKTRIASAVEGVVPGAQVTTVRDYTNALDGFAIEAPGSALSAIRQVEGVKTAFIEGVHKPLENAAQGSGAPVLNAARERGLPQGRSSGHRGHRLRPADRP